MRFFSAFFFQKLLDSMGRPKKNPPNFAAKGEQEVLQLSNSVLEAKSGDKLIPIEEGQSSSNAVSMSDMQIETECLKSLVKSLNRKAERE